jgi:hypothetical protein
MKVRIMKGVAFLDTTGVIGVRVGGPYDCYDLAEQLIKTGRKLRDKYDADGQRNPPKNITASDIARREREMDNQISVSVEPTVACPHGNDPTECNACFCAGDLAHDAAREDASR